MMTTSTNTFTLASAGLASSTCMMSFPCENINMVSMPAIQPVTVTQKRKRSFTAMEDVVSDFTQPKRKRTRPTSSVSSFPVPMEIDDVCTCNTWAASCPVPMDIDDDGIKTMTTSEEMSFPIPMDIDEEIAPVAQDESSFSIPIPMDIDDDLSQMRSEGEECGTFPLPMEIDSYWWY